IKRLFTMLDGSSRFDKKLAIPERIGTGVYSTYAIDTGRTKYGSKYS
ncbi:hypothetical protein D018_2037B, partial [Vibrio parahaemolyticus VP2007-007]